MYSITYPRILPKSTFITEIVNQELNAIDINNGIFKHWLCEVINKPLKTNNTYGLDINGIIIRKSDLQKNKPFGWKFVEINGYKTIVSYFYDITQENNLFYCLNCQYQLNPKLFAKNGIIYKVYIQHPDLKNILLQFLEFKKNYV